jgi:hypothetical protein
MGDSNTARLRLDAPGGITSQSGFRASSLMQREVRRRAAVDHGVNVEGIV